MPEFVEAKEFALPKSPPPYPPELRRRLVELVRAGRSPAELAKEFEPSEQCIRNWVKQADRDAGKRQDGLTTTGRSERPTRPRARRTGFPACGGSFGRPASRSNEIESLG